MIIVKMNDAAVECSIAASELQELGLTPEGIGTNDVRSVAFMSQLNKEIGAQLGFDPETDILMMSKNMMNDGSLRVFIMKMSNDDIQAAGDRIRAAAEGVLREVTQEHLDRIKNSVGPEKGRVLNDLLTAVMREMAQVMTGGRLPEMPENPEIISRPAVDYARYLAKLPDLRTCIRMSKALAEMPIEDSALYKTEEGYFMTLGLRTREDHVVFDLRRTCMEFAEALSINSPEELHIAENSDPVIAENAAQVLAGL
ncbi:MAG: adaptor protein MecA [Lachnospiraceae bacterium]|nr:adaptor protein MecA [Lachnospiraceae bacterium]